MRPFKRRQWLYLLFMTLFNALLLALLLSFFISCIPGRDSGRTGDPARVRMITESGTVVPGKPVHLAIEINLGKGWYTYWHNPGDAGLAPDVTWHIPSGWRLSPLELPVPERFEAKGIVSFGFTRQAVFLATLNPPSRGMRDSVALGVGINLLLCKEECIQFSDTVRLTLPVGEPPSEQRVDEKTKIFFEKARRKVPRSDTVISGTWHYTDNHRIELYVPVGIDMFQKGEVVFFPVTQGLFDYSGRQEVRQKKERIVISLVRATMQGEEPGLVRGLLVIKNRRSKDFPAAIFVQAEKS
ncbi:MAG: hypothetical protein JXA71_12500 [Chitinispirillaceae bacterium]|nr:hypothetical protein [Chitinispirillaceae bacterium]